MNYEKKYLVIFYYPKIESLEPGTTLQNHGSGAIWKNGASAHP